MQERRWWKGVQEASRYEQETCATSPNHLREPPDTPQDCEIGYLYERQGKLEQALDYYQRRALSLFEEVGDPAAIALSCHNIARIYQQQEQWLDALSFFSRAADLYES